MPGRPPTPIAIHKKTGTYRKDRHGGKFAPKPGDIGACPEELSGDAKEEWGRITGDHQYSAVLAPCHRSALIDYCNLHGKMMAEMRGEGKITSSERYMLHSLRLQFGLTPASAPKIRAPEQQETNRLAEFA